VSARRRFGIDSSQFSGRHPDTPKSGRIDHDSSRLVGDSTTSRYETITFTRRQRLTGEACREHFGTAPDSCLGDLDFENATATASMRVGRGP
jgi:hypothetical protein